MLFHCRRCFQIPTGGTALTNLFDCVVQKDVFFEPPVSIDARITAIAFAYEASPTVGSVSLFDMEFTQDALSLHDVTMLIERKNVTRVWSEFLYLSTRGTKVIIDSKGTTAQIRIENLRKTVGGTWCLRTECA